MPSAPGQGADTRQAFKPRDQIGTAAHRAHGESETAHSYAGLAFGLVFANDYEKFVASSDLDGQR